MTNNCSESAKRLKYSKALRKTINVYEDYAEKYFSLHSNINEIRDVIDSYIERFEGNTILDIGCGPGRDAQYFSQHGFSPVGIDLAAFFLKMARKNVPHVPFLKMDMRLLGFAEESFDGLWACASFMHIPRSEALNVLYGFDRVVKEGGTLFLAVIKGKEEKMVPNENYGGQQRFFAFYDVEEIQAMIEKANFHILETRINEGKDTWIDIYAKKL